MHNQQPPVPQPCHKCDAVYAGAVCPICSEERPAFTALKKITAAQRAAVADDNDIARIARACGAV